ncbi:hydroxyacylglutathione hydrolase [Sanghuangporus baumii]|uniref:hydroxyacylglutathione hydrolase n=1 Tax=Sanghuangporus baumii TaxID=108892 RepID=A0A9Q5MXY1_SANBA|nr:hydroxyacylglutathione hydrolase [Sanghuangporus baumii]
MKVVPVPVRSDNYAYLLIDDTTNQAAAVDPYDMKKVQAAAEKEGVEIEFAVLYPKAPIYGGSEQGSANTIVKDKVEFSVSEQLNVKCLATPCHTQDSICYYVTDKANPAQPGGVFTGDTLFIAGCGRFFEGTAAEMHRALSYLGTLPDETVVLNGHEYTKSNLAFAKSVEPNAPGMARLQKIVDENAVTTAKTTIGDEKEWNPFMRLKTPEILTSLGVYVQISEETIIDILRTMKNKF